ncbi:hypothetical protein ACOSP7_030725 [Xanthoceras sorbifolium]
MEGTMVADIEAQTKRAGQSEAAAIFKTANRPVTLKTSICLSGCNQTVFYKTTTLPPCYCVVYARPDPCRFFLNSDPSRCFFFSDLIALPPSSMRRCHPVLTLQSSKKKIIYSRCYCDYFYYGHWHCLYYFILEQLIFYSPSM